jgi:predicted house-cleaning noncanonical NTP pyrophosphatase (MazG superfamily)
LNTFKNELVNKVYEEIEKFLTATLDSKLTIYSANGFIVSINGILTKLDEEIESTIKENKTFEKNN